MAAKNIQELRADIMKEISKAMNVAANKALADMYEQTGNFYSGGEPIMYERTGALGDTPKTSGVTVSGQQASFDAYLDESGGYSTGKMPSMSDVLHLTNDGSFPGLRPAKGRTGYWDRAKENIEKDVVDTLQSFLS